MSVVDRFSRSMVLDCDKWHDGVGYDVSLLAEATPADRQAIEAMVLQKGVNDWRDVEVLAALKTTAAENALQQALLTGTAEVRGAVMRHAPALVANREKTKLLVEGLGTAQFYGGLSQMLDEVAEFHPPAVIAELLRGALHRKGDVAVHFAAMIFFLHGKATVPFDWAHRPFFLRFNTENRAEREAVFRELCAHVGVNAGEFIAQG
jgi:hypothetical protein